MRFRTIRLGIYLKFLEKFLENAEKNNGAVKPAPLLHRCDWIRTSDLPVRCFVA